MATLVDLGGGGFRTSLNGCALEFPCDCWENARASGMGFQAVLLAMHPHAFEVLDNLTSNVRLLEIFVSSLYRETGGGPHTSGRGVDIKALKQSEPVSVLLQRTGAEPEPGLVKEVREWLWHDKRVSQVLGPWFMCRAGKGCQPNRGQTPLEQQHLNHMHITLKP